MTWNERIKQAREASGIKPSSLAERIGLKAAAITQWENGSTKMITGENLVAACVELKVEPEWVISGTARENCVFQIRDGGAAIADKSSDSGGLAAPTRWEAKSPTEKHLLRIFRDTSDEGRRVIAFIIQIAESKIDRGRSDQS